MKVPINRLRFSIVDKVTVHVELVRAAPVLEITQMPTISQLVDNTTINLLVVMPRNLHCGENWQMIRRRVSFVMLKLVKNDHGTEMFSISMNLNLTLRCFH